MSQNIRKISFLNKIFNVRTSEWSKILFAWFIRFFYRVGFVIGWTVLIALIVADYGISFLPYLFVLNAIFIILGSFLYSLILDRFQKKHIMLFTILMASVLLLVAALVAPVSQVLFLSLLIVAEAVFLMQFRIITIGFTEKMFTPLQSERTFPIIEASETIGGIVGGLIITFLASSLEGHQFLYIWVFFLLLIFPTIVLYHFIDPKVPMIHAKKSTDKAVGFIQKVRTELTSVKHISFIKGLFLIVFLQWVLFNLLEFQYTKAVYQNLSHEVVLEGGSGLEHTFIHDLGALFVMFNALALVVQLFVGSRLINYLGVIGSMLIHPIVTLLSLFSLTFSFDLKTAVLAKTNFTVTTILHTNAYHSAYYAVKEKLRDYTRELLEGVVRPIGAIAGTSALIIMQFFLDGTELIFYVNVLMLAVALILFYITYLQQMRYTQVAIDDLQNSQSSKVRFNAIDILSQRGHSNASLEVLKSTLLDQKEPIPIRVAILRAFGELRNAKLVPVLIKCFESKAIAVRQGAIEALLNYRYLSRRTKDVAFMKYELMEALKALYKKESNDEVRSKIIILLSFLSSMATLSFLLEVLKTANKKLKADAVTALGNYSDPSVVEFIKPYLDDKDKDLRLAALIALGKFPEYEEEVEYKVATLLHSEKPSLIVMGIYALGELNLKHKSKICLRYLNSDSQKLKLHSALALAKMGYNESATILVDLLFSSDTKIASETKKLLQNVDIRISKNINRILRDLVSEKIEEFTLEKGINSLNDLKKRDLLTLKWLYTLVDEHDEIDLINKILKK